MFDDSRDAEQPVTSVEPTARWRCVKNEFEKLHLEKDAPHCVTCCCLPNCAIDCTYRRENSSFKRCRLPDYSSGDYCRRYHNEPSLSLTKQLGSPSSVGARKSGRRRNHACDITVDELLREMKLHIPVFSDNAIQDRDSHDRSINEEREKIEDSTCELSSRCRLRSGIVAGSYREATGRSSKLEETRDRSGAPNDEIIRATSREQWRSSGNDQKSKNEDADVAVLVVDDDDDDACQRQIMIIPATEDIRSDSSAADAGGVIKARIEEEEEKSTMERNRWCTTTTTTTTTKFMGAGDLTDTTPPSRNNTCREANAVGGDKDSLRIDPELSDVANQRAKNNDEDVEEEEEEEEDDDDDDDDDDDEEEEEDDEEFGSSDAHVRELKRVRREFIERIREEVRKLHRLQRHLDNCSARRNVTNSRSVSTMMSPRYRNEFHEEDNNCGKRCVGSQLRRA